MQPDYLFLTAGIGAWIVAMTLLWRAKRETQRRNRLVVVFWALFSLGLLIQGFAPHLKIERNKYVVPGEVLVRTNKTAKDFVEQERTMQFLSALLTGCAALGLAYCYRDLFRPTQQLTN